MSVLELVISYSQYLIRINNQFPGFRVALFRLHLQKRFPRFGVDWQILKLQFFRGLLPVLYLVMIIFWQLNVIVFEHAKKCVPFLFLSVCLLLLVLD